METFNTNKFVWLNNNPEQAEIREQILRELPSFLKKQLEFNRFGKKCWFSSQPSYSKEEVDFVTTGFILQILGSYTLKPIDNYEEEF